MNAGEILTEAAKIVEGSRQQTHGAKERSFAVIADLWTAYLRASDGSEITIGAADVAHMMVLLKMARSIYGEACPDHWIDMAGYAGLAGELATRKTDVDV